MEQANPVRPMTGMSQWKESWLSTGNHMWNTILGVIFSKDSKTWQLKSRLLRRPQRKRWKSWSAFSPKKVLTFPWSFPQFAPHVRVRHRSRSITNQQSFSKMCSLTSPAVCLFNADPARMPGMRSTDQQMLGSVHSALLGEVLRSTPQAAKMNAVCA